MTHIADPEARLLKWFDNHQEEMVSLLEELVNTDSGSADKAGVDKAGSVLIRFLSNAGISTSVVRDENSGDAIVATVQQSAASNEQPIVLLAHRDTVFEKGEASRRPFHIRDRRAFGPGVNDMKPGVVVNAFMLAAFKELGGLRTPLTGLFTGDEEIASPFSRPIIEQHARGAVAVFNTEPARPNGNIVTRRKGAVFSLLEIFGKAAHSGVNFFDGASAINELADKIVRLREITDDRKGITLNVGLVRGGQTINTVAPSATAEIDLRFVEQRDRASALSRILEITEDCRTAETSAKLTIKGEFLPFEETSASEHLFEIYKTAAAHLGIHVEGELTGGCSDSGFASAQGAPTLCGVGPVGGKSHSPQEYVELPTLLDRAKVLALAIHRVSAEQSQYSEVNFTRP